jgi:hypothetical protein
MPSPSGLPRVSGVRLAFICLALGACLVPTRSYAQGADTSALDPCDPRLARPAKDPLGYERRGDRCEGLYIQEVAGSAGLLVASLIEAAPSFAFAPGERLRLEWTAEGQPAVRLRAVALRRRLYYRMDAVRPAGSSTFEWPTDILASLKMSTQELGLVGWMERQVGPRLEDVYVPLRMGKGQIARSGRYVLLIVPGNELSEIYVTLAEVGPDGRDVAVIRRDERLGYGYYPAERSIRVQLPVLDRPAVYRLQLGAALSRGGSTTKTIFFYHAGG